MLSASPPVFRFAPSPNGHLHLGHAYSALINQNLAKAHKGRMLLRIEDIDKTRCTPKLESEMLEDLNWLGFHWEDEPRHQSQHFNDYTDALESLQDAGLVYPAFMTRSDIRTVIIEKTEEGVHWPSDPDGTPHYPGTERHWSSAELQKATIERPNHTWRLNMQSALEHVNGELMWQETGFGPDGETDECLANPSAWGDVVVARSDTPTSYHLAATFDDALQGITHVVRGRDLFHSTSVHRLLQTLLGLPVPTYHHHDLVLGDDHRKLSKSAHDTSLRALRQSGMTPQDIKRMVGL